MVPTLSYFIMEYKHTVLVTGGCGFIGTNFIKRLKEVHKDWQVFNLDKLTYAGINQNNDELSTFIHGDICNVELVDYIFKEFKIDLVVNFAAESHVDRSIESPRSFMDTNILGTFTLLEIANKYWNVRNPNEGKPLFLHVSTDEVFGTLGDDDNPFNEKTPYHPRSPYSASKASSDHIVKSYFYTYGLPVIVTNCSNNYGPHQHPEKLIPKVIVNAVNGLEIPVYGNGANIRDWLYVDDHCNALLDIIEKGVYGHSYAIGGDEELTNLNLVKFICELLDDKLSFTSPRSKLITKVKDRLGHDYRYSIDYTKTSDTLNWEPLTTLHEGLSNTIDWYLANMGWAKDICK